MADNILVQTPPDVSSQLKVNVFVPNDFNAALWENGFKIILERAVRCPCKGNSPDARTSCNNCLGTGWVFVNPIRTRAFLNSINKSTQYKDWSPQFIGTVAVSLMNFNKLSHMDKITLEEGESVMSENLLIRRILIDGQNKVFVFCTYKPLRVESMFLFDGDITPLKLMSPNSYFISENNGFIIEITDFIPLEYTGSVSLTYIHRVSYNILDIPHDFRITKVYDNSGKRTTAEMPVQAIARKSQYEMGVAQNYEGNNILNNSYK